VETGTVINNDAKKWIRTQAMGQCLKENSTLTILNRKSFAKTEARFGENPMMFETLPMESLDIDDQPQWDQAEAVALYQRNKL